MTNAVNLASAAGTGFAFRNKIINGGFDVWQRATSQSTGGYGSADRWQVGTSSTSLSRSTDVPTGFTYSANLTGTSVSNAQILHRIEAANCADLVGQPITVSFWAKSTAGTTQLGVILYNATAVDNFASTTTINSSFFTLTSTWTRYTVTLTSAAPAGVTNGIQLLFYRNGTETSTTFFTGIQLEVGSVATPFERRPYGLELALCQRYYEQDEVPMDGSPKISTGGLVQTSTFVIYPFKVTKRTTPTCTLTQVLNIDNSNGTLSVQQVSSGAMRVAIGIANTSFFYSVANIRYTSSAEL